jgi:hypothetical protein
VAGKLTVRYRRDAPASPIGRLGRAVRGHVSITALFPWLGRTAGLRGRGNGQVHERATVCVRCPAGDDCGACRSILCGSGRTAVGPRGRSVLPPGLAWLDEAALARAGWVGEVPPTRGGRVALRANYAGHTRLDLRADATTSVLVAVSAVRAGPSGALRSEVHAADRMLPSAAPSGLASAHFDRLAVGRMPHSSGLVGRKALSPAGLGERRSRLPGWAKGALTCRVGRKALSPAALDERRSHLPRWTKGALTCRVGRKALSPAGLGERGSRRGVGLGVGAPPAAPARRASSAPAGAAPAVASTHTGWHDDHRPRQPGRADHFGAGWRGLRPSCTLRAPTRRQGLFGRGNTSYEVVQSLGGG